MTDDSVRTYVLWGVRGILALVFIVSGVGKLIDGQTAVHVTETILGNMIGQTSAYVLVVFVSLAEVGLAGLLIWGRKVPWTLFASVGMVAVFTIGLGSLLGRDGVTSCGCFGAFGVGGSVEETILRNLILIALMLLGIILSSGSGRQRNSP